MCSGKSYYSYQLLSIRDKLISVEIQLLSPKDKINDISRSILRTVHPTQFNNRCLMFQDWNRRVELFYVGE